MEMYTRRESVRTWTLGELMMGAGAANGGDWSNSPPPNATIIYKIGIYGWRKRCLYVFLLLIMVTVIINMALTIWMLRVMDFTIDGMGPVRILDDGIQVEGDSHFLESLSAARIKSRENSALYLESAKNITLNARDGEGTVINRLVIGDSKVESYAKRFEVRDLKDKLLFAAADDEVFLGASKLNVGGSEGVTFKGSVQTPVVRSDADNLRLESPSRSLHMSAPEGITVRSPAGPVSVDSRDDIRIESLNKAIILDAKNINMKNIQVSSPNFDGNPYPQVYQLCICGDSGKLFLSPARGNCQATSAICS